MINGKEPAFPGTEEQPQAELRQGDEERVPPGAEGGSADQLAPGSADGSGVGGVAPGSRGDLTPFRQKHPLAEMLARGAKIGDYRGQEVGMESHRRLPQVVRINMPTRFPHQFDLQLMQPANILDAFFGEEMPALHLGSGPARPVPVPLLVFDVDPTADMWRHEFIMAQAQNPLRTAYPVRGLKTMLLGDKIIVLYEVLNPPDRRLPHVEAVAMRAYVESDRQQAKSWDKLSKDEVAAEVEEAARTIMPRLAAMAEVVWGNSGTAS